MNEKQKELWEMCRSYAKEIEGIDIDPESYKSYQELDEEEKKDWKPSGYDFIAEKTFSISYIVDQSRQFEGAELLLAGGGPTIWLDTREKTIYASLGGDKAESYYTDEIGLHDACEESWDGLQ